MSNSKAIETCFYCTFAAKVHVRVCWNLGGDESGPEALGEAPSPGCAADLAAHSLLPASVSPLLPCNGPTIAYLGKTTELCGWERPDPRLGVRGAQQPGKTFCFDLDLEHQISRDELKGFPCAGARPSAPTPPNLHACGYRHVFGEQAGVQAAWPCFYSVFLCHFLRSIGKEFGYIYIYICAPACFPSLHRAGEGESERKREGKDMSNQSYLNKSLFGPRALLKAAYLIKSPIFHIYGPYSVKY